MDINSSIQHFKLGYKRRFEIMPQVSHNAINKFLAVVPRGAQHTRDASAGILLSVSEHSGKNSVTISTYPRFQRSTTGPGPKTKKRFT